MSSSNAHTDHDPQLPQGKEVIFGIVRVDVTEPELEPGNVPKNVVWVITFQPHNRSEGLVL